MALATLAQQFDVDTTVSQKRVSWGMRIASTLGGLAICAAVVLFFAALLGLPDIPPGAIEDCDPDAFGCAGGRGVRRPPRANEVFYGLAIFGGGRELHPLNLAVVGSVFNIVSTERALLAWATFAIVLAYRYGLRLMLILQD